MIFQMNLLAMTFPKSVTYWLRSRETPARVQLTAEKKKKLKLYMKTYEHTKLLRITLAEAKHHLFEHINQMLVAKLRFKIKEAFKTSISA